MVGSVLAPTCVILMPDPGQLFGLGHKSALITGAGSGIGQAIASTFAARGACIHILVNSVGMAHVGTLESTSPRDLDLIFRMKRPKLLQQYARVDRPNEGQRRWCNPEYRVDFRFCGPEGRFAYSMSKGAVVAMTYSVAKDYLEYKLRCNSISPARVHTPFVDGFLHQNYPGREPEVYEILARSQPIGRMAQPHEIASLARFLCSKRLLSSRAVIIRSTAVSATCGDSHD